MRSPGSPSAPPFREERTGPMMPAPRLADRLTDALRSEAKLLGELAATMRRQRDAVAADDLDAIDESVFSTHRVLSTLGETRRRRRWLAQLLGESEDLSLSTLESFFKGELPENVRDATTELADAARALQHEVDLNRHVLRTAIEASDAYVRSLCGLPSRGTAVYSDAHGSETAPGGYIVDRRV